MSKRKRVHGADNPAYVDRWHNVPLPSLLGKKKPREKSLSRASRGHCPFNSSGVTVWLKPRQGVKTLGGEATTKKENENG